MSIQKIKAYCIALALVILPVRVSAQRLQSQRPADETTVALANVGIGAVTSGIWSAATRKGSFWEAFGRGAAGGAAVYAGKRLIGEGNAPGWWVGRQIAAIGASEISNASQGKKFLQTTVLPLGILRVHIDRTAKKKVSPRIDVAAVVVGAIVGMGPDTRFGVRESFSTGTVVFVKSENDNNIGRSSASIVSVSELAPDPAIPGLESKRSVLSHEIIHASQYDFIFTAFGDAIQSAAGRRSPLIARASRYFDLNFTLPLQAAANGLIGYHDRPWEREASSLATNAP